MIRLGITVLLSGNIPLSDAQDYNTLAQAMLHSGIYMDEAGNTFSRPPLYPLFLFGIYSVFGISYPLIYLIQAFLSIIICLLSYFIGRELNGKDTGILCCILTCLVVELIIYPSLLLSEIVFIFLFSLSLLFLIYHIKKGQTFLSYWGCLSGFLMGLATLTRPITLGLFPFCLVLIIMGAWINKKPLRLFKKFIIPFICLIIVLLPWTFRNYQISHSFIPVAAIDGINFWIGHHSGATGSYDWPENGNPLLKLDYNELTRNAAGWKYGISFIIGHPIEEMKLAGFKAFRLLNPLPDYSFQQVSLFREFPFINWVVWLLSAFFWEFLLLCCITRPCRDYFQDEIHVLFTLILFYFILNQIVFFCTPRYKIPLIITIIFLQGDYLSTLYQKWGFRKYFWKSVLNYKKAGILIMLQLLGGIVIITSR